MGTAGIPTSLQRRVRVRAQERCEYCRIPQQGQEATFHVDHVQPRRDGGPTTLDNLALACVSCPLRKGARSTSTDPASGKTTSLFNPRHDDWLAHFSIGQAGHLESSTPAGRATIAALLLNRPTAVAIRAELLALHRYP